MMMKNVSSPVIVLSLLLFVTACAPSRPSVIIVTIDSLRADEIFAEIDGVEVAPVLNAFARESVVFERAISAAPWTTPAAMSLMTGLPAPAHGVGEHDRALGSTVPTLAEAFRDAGYRTAAFVPAITLREEYGFSKGFENYDFQSFGHDKISSPALIGKVEHQVSQWRDEPFFIWVHLWDPHYNYIPQPPYDQKFERGAKPERDDVQQLKWDYRPVEEQEAEWLKGQYEGEIGYTDRYFKNLLETLRSVALEDDVIIAVLADHGEAFLEHGWLGHTNQLNDPLLHVPLMIRWPKALQARHVEGLVGTEGLGRTLLELAGIETAEQFGAAASLPVLENSQIAPNARVVSETIRRACLTSLTTERYRYVLDFETCEERLFDLQTDAQEQFDVAESHPDVVRELRLELREELQAMADLKIPRGMMPKEIVDHTKQRLESMGYIQAGGSGKKIDMLENRTSRHRTCPSSGPLGCF